MRLDRIDDRSHNICQFNQKTHPGVALARGTSIPKFIIERDIPSAGSLTPADLQGISQKSCGVLRQLGPSVQWMYSYVTADKVYCIYLADNEQLIRQHAEQGGFPVNRIEEIKTIIDPTTAET